MQKLKIDVKRKKGNKEDSQFPLQITIQIYQDIDESDDRKKASVRFSPKSDISKKRQVLSLCPISQRGRFSSSSILSCRHMGKNPENVQSV